MTRQKLPATAVAVTLALLTTGEHAIAQGSSELEMRLEAGAARTSSVSALLPTAGMAVTPGLRFANRGFSLDTKGSAWLNGQEWSVGDARVTTESDSRTWHGVRGELLANASRIMASPTDVSNQVDATGRLHFIRQRGGIWVGSGIVRPLLIATVANASVNSGGVWTKLGSTTLRATVTNVLLTKFASNDTVSGFGAVTACPTVTSPAVATTPGIRPSTSALTLPTNAPSCRRESRLTDVEGDVRWEHRLLELSLRGGQRFGERVDVTPSSRTWGSAHAAIWLSSQLAAIVAGGNELAQPTRGLPARRFASVGVMLAYWPIPRGTVPVESPVNRVRAFELRPAGFAVQRLTARIGSVESVEIMGDFTDWVPMPLVRRGRDHWELLIPMGPGVHHMNLRIDGGKWVAPPGMPAIRDDFSGEVGVVVIKS
jgi:hypothetical protein